MAESEVSSVIHHLLDAFQNGSNVFRGTARKHKRRPSGPSQTDEDKITLDSLSQRPQEIKRTYDSLVVTHGRCFQVGDSAAQTALAQILLVFNTGLIKLLNHVLSDDKKARSHARCAVYSLSETAAMDTLIALSELDHRLTTIAKLSAKLSSQNKNNDDSSALRKPRSRSSSSSQPMATRRPPPTPRLHNGGWVRSKSDPSTVSVVVASKAKKGDQRKISPSNSPVASTVQMANPRPKEQISPPPRYSQLAPRSPPSTTAAPQPRPKPAHLQSYPAATLPAVPETVERQIVRHPSMYIVPGDFFDVHQSSSAARDQLQPPSSPPVPPKVPLHSRPRRTSAPAHSTIVTPKLDEIQPNATQDYIPPPLSSSTTRTGPHHPRPVSMMTFMTASTKIGEIPDHHLPDRLLTQEEQDRIPMPYVLPDLLEQPKRKNRGLKFWKKQERSPLGAVNT